MSLRTDATCLANKYPKPKLSYPTTKQLYGFRVTVTSAVLFRLLHDEQQHNTGKLEDMFKDVQGAITKVSFDMQSTVSQVA